MSDNRKMLATLGLLSILGVVAITYFALKVGAVNVGDQQKFVLLFDNAIGIPDNADVRVYGIKVGSVQGMELATAPHRGAYVNIAVEKGFKVYEDARAVIKSKSLLGERFIELQPGIPETTVLTSGAMITDTITPLRLEDIGEIMGPLVTNIDSEQMQMAFSTLLDVVVENREAIRQSGKAFATALIRMTAMIDDEEDIVRLQQFLNSLTDMVVRLDRITGDNEEVMVGVLQDAGAVMGDMKVMTAELKELSSEFPEYSDDIGYLIKAMARMMREAEKVDMKKLGLVLKKVMQQEGVTFSVRGYKMKELREQMDEYDRIMDEDFESSIKPSEDGEKTDTECTPALIQTGKCR